MVVMQVEEAAAPAHEQPEREQRDHHADARLGGRLHGFRQVGLEDDDRQPEGEEAGRVPEAPGESEASSRAGGPVAAGRDQRRDGGEVVGVGRVAETQYDRDDDHQRQGRPVREVRDPGVESEHVSSLSGGRARSWQDQRPG